MAQKVKINNQNGVQVFPITHISAVIDSNGNSVEQILGAQTDLINQAQLEVGAVESDLTPTEGSTHWVTSGGVHSAIKTLSQNEAFNALFASLETGINFIDPNKKIGMRYNQDGFDVAKLSSHFMTLLQNNGVFVDNIATVSENGFFIVDSNLNVGFKVDDNGAHAINIIGFETINY